MFKGFLPVLVITLNYHNKINEVVLLSLYSLYYEYSLPKNNEPHLARIIYYLPVATITVAKLSEIENIITFSNGRIRFTFNYLLLQHKTIYKYYIETGAIKTKNKAILTR